MKTNKKNYFDQAEIGITKYLNSKNTLEKNIIFEKEIYLGFCKLIENIIFTFNFQNLDKYEDLKQEVLYHLFKNIEKFDYKHGAKAYSYFGTVAKRYLIGKSNDLLQVSKEEFEESRSLLDNNNKNNDENIEFIKYLKKSINNYKCQDDIDKKIIETIIYFLENYENIELISKRHFFVILKQYTNLSYKELTHRLNSILDFYYNEKEKYISCK